MLIKKGVTVGIMTMLGLGAAAADLKEGMKAPAFEAKDQAGRTIRLSDYAGKKNVVLYFYPKDDTPGCTKEACSLRDGHGPLLAAGAVVLGVVEAHAQAAFGALGRDATAWLLLLAVLVWRSGRSARHFSLPIAAAPAGSGHA